MPMPELISSDPPPYESHDFSPELTPRIPTKKFQAFKIEAKKGAGQKSSHGSYYISSDDADSMNQRWQGNG